ncbi:hypothetical protein Pyrde_1351 [Pyrodictium delaneyi]|uniref:Uncharacterized protein n=1 Tax=Pyrodictium delaneyi TaxID=1273541 RepID=A0A0P0N4L5_9CREN|nr:hypothetical protein [Pyrodictium delaneyi]ALL01397.1 hypothetical protein Pyrde_1351 [Pyrodictium delaneyi]OWJ54504.1 hypothetical protein Pdsh_06825 [Pyrodictium delaneyi]OWJ54684.1 hypothetical protein Pdsh_06610 [Pyrodictium delaneyi]
MQIVGKIVDFANAMVLLISLHALTPIAVAALGPCAQKEIALLWALVGPWFTILFLSADSRLRRRETRGIEAKILDTTATISFTIILPSLAAALLVSGLAKEGTDKSVLAFTYFAITALSSPTLYAVWMLCDSAVESLFIRLSGKINTSRKRLPSRARYIVKTVKWTLLLATILLLAYIAYVYWSIWGIICTHTE